MVWGLKLLGPFYLYLARFLFAECWGLSDDEKELFVKYAEL